MIHKARTLYEYIEELALDFRVGNDSPQRKGRTPDYEKREEEARRQRETFGSSTRRNKKVPRRKS